jgi:DNA-binding transcriptional ArsR family regulator
MKTSSHFLEDDQKLAQFAAAMAHPARIAIVRLLLSDGEHTCGQLTERLPLAQATVSQHLKALLEAGIVTVRPCGPRRCYQLDTTQICYFCEALQVTLGRKSQPKHP